MTRLPSSGSQRDRDLDAELQAHLDMATRDRIAAGADPAAARAAARRQFGNLGQVSEATRGMWRFTWWERFRRDVRHAFRGWMRSPGLAIVAVVTLALGIGANSAIFTVVHSVLLRPLPFPHADQLVYITSQFPGLGLDHFPLDGAEFIELRQRNRTFSDVGTYATNAVNVGSGAQVTRVTSAVASASLFTTLGVSPAIGRIFSATEDAPNGPPVAILSWELWQSVFGGAPIVGKTVEVGGVPSTVIGIMPAGFDVHDQGVRIWTAAQLDPANVNQYRGGHGFFLVGRRKPGVSMQQARVDLERMLNEWPVLDGGSVTLSQGNHSPNAVTHRLRYDDLLGDMVGSAGRALWVLQAAVALVLLIACANLANLLMMRAAGRQRELGVRLALGATRGHLVRQFLAEGLVLSIGGAIAGVLLAKIGLHALTTAYAGSVPRVTDVAIDPVVLLFTLAIALGTGALFGMAPLLHIDRDGSANMLREGGARTTVGAARRGVQRGLVIAEIAMAVMLVVGAGLLVRSLWNLLSVDTGFQRDQLTTFRVSLSPVPYADSMRRVAFFERLTHDLAAVPGVNGVAAMQGLPPLRPINANDTQFEGIAPTPGQPPLNVDYWQWVTPGYLSTMGIRLIAGRDLQESDAPTSPPVVLINQTLAKKFYPGVNPLGRRVKLGGSNVWFTIVGVVKDVKQQGIDTKPGTELYIPYAQSPGTLGFAPTSMNVVMRSPLAPAALSPAIHRIVASLDPAVPVAQLRTMDDVVLASISRPRFIATLLGVFAFIALALAAVGTYGVLAYAVSQRQRELGIRMALGARASAVLNMVLGQGLRLAGIGIAVGLVGALILTRLVRSLLFGVSATDPVIFIGVAGMMTLVATLACFIPARRATRVDPITALRGE
ncbi:MAG TPA: ABC transporter permease [Gemmatimonadales bacterium]|jgi:predicted permease